MMYALRGTGRTSEILMGMEKGDIFVVHNSSMCSYVCALLDHLRGREFRKNVEIIRVERREDIHLIHQRLFRGTARPPRVLVDHTFWELAAPDVRGALVTFLESIA